VFGTVRELGSNDVQQPFGGDVAARRFGVQPGSKLLNGDRHRPGLGPPSTLLFAFELSAFGTRQQQLL